MVLPSRERRRRVVYVIVILAGLLLATCRDPESFKPDDPYTEPPPPPEFIFPLEDTVLNGVVVSVYFNWTAVAGAESYDIQYDTSLTWPTDWREITPATTTYIAVYRYAFTTVYYYRIRALSASWLDGHTEWSQTRKFYVKPEG